MTLTDLNAQAMQTNNQHIRRRHLLHSCDDFDESCGKERADLNTFMSKHISSKQS